MAKRQTVTYALLHQNFFVPSQGEMGKTFPPVGKTVKLDMYLTTEGLVLKFGKQLRTPAATALVPYPNIVGMLLGPEVEIEENSK